MRHLGRQRASTQVKAVLGGIVVAALAYGVAARLEHQGLPTKVTPVSVQQATSQAQPAPMSDYFPDRYRNQATEPAEPIATF
jgi:hypothetical protein